MKKYYDAKDRGDRRPCQAISHLKGYYRCCVYKWAKQRVKENWEVFCRASHKLARKFKECPDVLRTFFGNPKKFQSRCSKSAEPGTTCILPQHFVDLVGESVVARSHCKIDMLFFCVSPILFNRLQVFIFRYVY